MFIDSPIVDLIRKDTELANLCQIIENILKTRGVIMEFSIRNFLGLMWKEGLKNALKIEVVQKTDVEFDDFGLEMVDKVIDQFLMKKEKIEG